MSELVTIRLSGQLGSKFGRRHVMAVSHVGEAIRALGSQLRGFDAYLTQSKDRGVAFAVFYDKKNLEVDDLHEPVAGRTIRIAPMIMGAKKQGIFSIILGAVLVAVGTFLAPYTGGLSAALIKYGYAMIIGGVVQLLTPTPKGSAAKDRPENQPSAYFNGPVNTQAQGYPVQVQYGRLIRGSAVISASITAQDQVYIPTTTPVAGSGGRGGGGSPPWHLDFQAQQ